MKKIFAAGALSICGFLALGSTSVYAAAITLTPGDCDDFAGSIACDSGGRGRTGAHHAASIWFCHPAPNVFSLIKRINA